MATWNVEDLKDELETHQEDEGNTKVVIKIGDKETENFVVDSSEGDFVIELDPADFVD